MSVHSPDEGKGELDNTPKHRDTPEYSEATKGLQPLSISHRHRALMRRLVAGGRLKDVCEELGFTVARASLVANSPLFKEEMARMQAQVDSGVIKLEAEKPHIDGGVRAQLEEEALASLRVIVGLRDGAKSERVQQVSALEILDRAGYAKTDKVEGKLQLEASPGLADAIQTAIREMRKKDGTDG